jgi:hypothetical protein
VVEVSRSEVFYWGVNVLIVFLDFWGIVINYSLEIEDSDVYKRIYPYIID